MENSEKRVEQLDEERKAEVKLKSTVVDIDRVRDDEVQEEKLGLLEAAQQDDGKLNPGNIKGDFYVGIWVPLSSGAHEKKF